MKRNRLLISLTALLIGALLAAAAPVPETTESGPASKVMVIRLDGSVNPGSADFFIMSMRQAHNSGYHAIVIELDTPAASSIPPAISSRNFSPRPFPSSFSSRPRRARGQRRRHDHHGRPRGRHGAGHNIGAAHPVSGGGEEMDEVMKEKVTNDTAAWIEGIAEQRGRNKEWAVKAVRDSVSVTATDALKNNVIDLIADDLADLLKDIDGRVVTLGDKSEVTLRTAGADVARSEPGLKHRVIMRLADPTSPTC